VKQAEQVLFIHLAETEKTYFFTVNYMVYVFFQTVIKVTEQYVHQSPSEFLVFLSPGGWRNVIMVLELRSIPFGYSCAALTVVHL